MLILKTVFIIGVYLNHQNYLDLHFTLLPTCAHGEKKLDEKRKIIIKNIMVVTGVLLVLPHSGAVQVISIGLQNTSMVSFQVLPFT